MAKWRRERTPEREDPGSSHGGGREREDVLRREEFEGRRACIVKVEGKKYFYHKWVKFITGIPKAIFWIL